jgi:hypothetical protein
VQRVIYISIRTSGGGAYKLLKTKREEPLALEYVFGKVQGNEEGLKLNRTCLLLVYADDVNLLAKNIYG